MEHPRRLESSATLPWEHQILQKWCNTCNICVVSTAAGILHSTTCWLLESSLLTVFLLETAAKWVAAPSGHSCEQSTIKQNSSNNFMQIHSQLSLHYVLSGAFTKQEWRASVSCAITSACPSSRLHRATLPPVGRFLLNFILVIFGKIWEENSNLIKIRQSCHFTWRQMNIYVYAGCYSYQYYHCYMFTCCSGYVNAVEVFCTADICWLHFC